MSECVFDHRGGGSGLERVSVAVQFGGMLGLGLEAAAGTCIAAIDGCLISRGFGSAWSKRIVLLGGRNVFGQLCHCAGHERIVGYQKKRPLPHSDIEERGY